MTISNFNSTESLLLVISASLIIWLSIISILFANLKYHYHRLISKTNKNNLQEVLDSLLEETKKQDKTLQSLKKQLEMLIINSTYELRYLGFLRFNPFGDTGGDQSFALALLDQHKNGFMISSLHSRENTRIYAKKVVKGMSEEFPLSEEEKKAITIARELKP